MPNDVHKIAIENGYYIFKLEKLLFEMNKSRYAIAKDLPLEYKVLNRYVKGNLSRFDANVIAKICDYCNCKLSDIIEYYPNEK